MPLLCQATVVARLRSKTPGPNIAGILTPRAGWLLKYHCGSPRETESPPSPSNDSRYACCEAFVCGRLAASSAVKPLREGIVVAPKASRETRLVSGSGDRLNKA